MLRMACSHDAYRSISTSYDRARGLLVYFWTCDRCGAYLKELRRRDYEPRFERHGNASPAECAQRR